MRYETGNNQAPDPPRACLEFRLVKITFEIFEGAMPPILQRPFYEGTDAQESEWQTKRFFRVSRQTKPEINRVR